MTEYVYRWVAETVAGEPNTGHVRQLLHRGWEPCPADDPAAQATEVQNPIDTSLRGKRGMHLMDLGGPHTGLKLYRCSVDKVELWREHLRERSPEFDLQAARDAYLADNSHPQMNKFIASDEDAEYEKCMREDRLEQQVAASGLTPRQFYERLHTERDQTRLIQQGRVPPK